MGQLNQVTLEPKAMTLEYLNNFAGHMRSIGVPPYPCGRFAIVCKGTPDLIALLDKSILPPRPKPPMAGKYLGATESLYVWGARNV
jgi:hypothetical protein